MNHLYTKLKILGAVTCFRYNHILPIMEGYKNSSVTLLAGDWQDSYYKKYKPLPEYLKRNDTWGTYEGCTSVILRVVSGGRIEADVTIWDGESLNGNRTNIRWTATFAIHNQIVLNPYAEAINRAFDEEAEAMYEQEQETKRKSRISAIKQELLNTTL